MESIQRLKGHWVMHQENSGDERGKASVISTSEQVTEVKLLLEKEVSIRKRAEEELSNLKYQLMQRERSEAAGISDILKHRKTLEGETRQKEKLEEEIAILQNQLLQLSFEADKTRRQLDQNGDVKVPNSSNSPISQVRNQQLHDSGHKEKASVAKLFEQVGLQKILSLLEAKDPDVLIHAVKVIANLAAEETNQERTVEAGGLASLLMLYQEGD